MPNDAKLGLLAGVMGVLVAAVVSVQRPAPQPGASADPPRSTPVKAVATPAPKPEAHAAPADPPRSPAVLPTALPSTPVVRTRKEPDATPASRTRNDDDIDD